MTFFIFELRKQSLVTLCPLLYRITDSNSAHEMTKAATALDSFREREKNTNHESLSYRFR